MAIKMGVDPNNLSEAGWGLIMPYASDPAAQQQNAAARDGLRELLAYRHEQAGDRYKEYVDAEGYRPGESKSQFLARNGLGIGPVPPEVMPYYLLIAGDPSTIPYRFQEQLEVQFAVGRIHFDTPEQYANYGRAVVAAESNPSRAPRRAAFFAPTSPDDRHSEATARAFTLPLSAAVAATKPDWQIITPTGAEATRERLSGLLQADAPAFVYAAGHGMVFDESDPRKLAHQGALLCADWPGPQQWHAPIPPHFYFSADDVTGTSSPILMLLASYSNGTPGSDWVRQRAQPSRGTPATSPAFVARMPQRLLGQGAGLAVIGLNDRRYSGSVAPQADLDRRRIDSHTQVIRRLLDGAPMGLALQTFGERYAELATQLSTEIEEVRFGRVPDAPALADLWADVNDMRSVSIFGDPAARLPTQVSRGKNMAQSYQ